MRCLRGRKERFAKPSYGLNCTEGSNPSLTASPVYFWVSGRSVARLSRLLWEQEVASSNLAAPTEYQGLMKHNFISPFSFAHNLHKISCITNRKNVLFFNALVMEYNVFFDSKGNYGRAILIEYKPLTNKMWNILLSILCISIQF